MRARPLRCDLTGRVAAECERLGSGFAVRDIAAAIPTVESKRVARVVSMLCHIGWIIPTGEIKKGRRRFTYRWHGREGAIRRRARADRVLTADEAIAHWRTADEAWRARMGGRARFDAALTATEVAQIRRITEHGTQAEQGDRGRRRGRADDRATEEGQDRHG